MSWDEEPSMSAWLDEWARNSKLMIDTFALSNMGSHQGNDGPVLWGMRYPDTTLLVFEMSPEGKCLLNPVDRNEWKSITNHQPPWPWNYDGTMLMVPDPGTDLPWWQK